MPAPKVAKEKLEEELHLPSSSAGTVTQSKRLCVTIFYSVGYRSHNNR